MEESRVLDVLIEWLRVRDMAGRPLPLGYEGLADEVEHSALLERMLSGKQPLPVAPPRSFGRPWYALVEDGVATDCQVIPLRDRLGACPKVAINETAWEVVDTVPGGYVVRHGRDETLYVAERTQDDPPRFLLRRHDLWLEAQADD